MKIFVSLFFVLSINAYSQNLLDPYSTDATPVLNKALLENSIESKRRVIVSLGMTSFIGERIVETQVTAPKTGYITEVGFELFRDVLNWNIYASYIPKSNFTTEIKTSVTDFGIELKGRSVFSRFSSFFGGAGLLLRRELISYPMYSISSGIDFSPDSSVFFSPGIIFKSSLKKYDFPQSIASKTFEVFIKFSVTI